MLRTARARVRLSRQASAARAAAVVDHGVPGDVRRHGVVTAHSPSIALTAIAFIDASEPPRGRVFRYGTLRLDSVAQRDAPLSRFDNVPDVVAVTHRVLELRTRAMPTFPPPVL